MMNPALSRALALALAGSALASASASAQVDFFYTADGDDTLRQGVAGTVVSNLPAGNPRDVDAAGGNLFYTDFTQDKVFTVPTAGGTPTEVLDIAAAVGGNPTIFSIEPDATGSTIYFVEANTDKVYSATGGAVSEILDIPSTFQTARNNPRGVAFDAAAGKVYWTDVDTDTLYRVNLDGSSPEAILDLGALAGGNATPNAVALDVAGNRLFVAEDNGDFLATAALDGTNASILVDFDDAGLLPDSAGASQTTFRLNDLEYFSGRLFVADGTNGVFSLDADTGGGFAFGPGAGDSVGGVAVVPEPTTAAVLALGGLALAARRRNRG